jgi:hypothetical protein
MTLPVRHRRPRRWHRPVIAVLVGFAALAGGWSFAASLDTPTRTVTGEPAVLPPTTTPRTAVPLAAVPSPTKTPRAKAPQTAAAVAPVPTPRLAAARPSAVHTAPALAVPVPVRPTTAPTTAPIPPTPDKKVWTQAQTDEWNARCVAELGAGATAYGMPAVGSAYTVPPARRCTHPPTPTPGPIQ